LSQVKEAKTIDEIIQQLEQLIHACANSKDRIGYFASLYYKVTVRVRDAIQKGQFEDNARMEQFDVTFANRYLTAVRQWQNKKHPTGPWQVALDTSKKSSRLVLQHLLLGMNAHINLDLGIAAVQASGNNPIAHIRKDFNSINDILGAMTFEVLQEINRISPLLSLFGVHASNDTILIQFSITNARDGAWSFAEGLSSKKGKNGSLLGCEELGQLTQRPADRVRQVPCAFPTFFYLSRTLQTFLDPFFPCFLLTLSHGRVCCSWLSPYWCVSPSTQSQSVLI